jgi:hypothetical protein
MNNRLGPQQRAAIANAWAAIEAEDPETAAQLADDALVWTINRVLRYRLGLPTVPAESFSDISVTLIADFRSQGILSGDAAAEMADLKDSLSTAGRDIPNAHTFLVRVERLMLALNDGARGLPPSTRDSGD